MFSLSYINCICMLLFYCVISIHFNFWFHKLVFDIFFDFTFTNTWCPSHIFPHFPHVQPVSIPPLPRQVNKNPFGFAPKEQLVCSEIQPGSSSEAGQTVWGEVGAQAPGMSVGVLKKTLIILYILYYIQYTVYMYYIYIMISPIYIYIYKNIIKPDL